MSEKRDDRGQKLGTAASHSATEKHAAAPSAKQKNPPKNESRNGTSGGPSENASRDDEEWRQDESVPWDGFWPLTVSDLIHRREAVGSTQGAAATVDDGMRCLRRLAASDDLVGWNASILWAQHDPASAVEVADVLQMLVTGAPRYFADTGAHAAAGDAANREASGATSSTNTEQKNDVQPTRLPRTLSNATRCAAAEAWCLVLAAGAADPVDGLAPAGRLLERTQLPNDVRAELFRGVARWVRPAAIPRLENALRAVRGKDLAPVEIRRAAIDACLEYATWNASQRAAGASHSSAAIPYAWPSTVMNCRIDPDPPVRRTFLRWLGRANPPDAFELLKSQADSGEIDLRQVAIESLGTLHTEQAKAALEAEYAKTRDRLRAATVRAIATWGFRDVLPYVHDASHEVRVAAAQELANYATLESAQRLAEMTVDNAADVQLAAVDAVTNWPDTLAFPLLLRAMRDSSAKTRYNAWQQLSVRRAVAGAYRFDGPPADREAAVNAIAGRLGSSVTYLNQVLSKGGRAAAGANELRREEIRAHLTALIENPPDSASGVGAREWLAGVSARDVAVVEAYLQEPTRARTDPIYHDVLPKVSPIYAALVDLENADVKVRRLGAETLADHGAKATLTHPVLLRLRELLAHEADEVVWRWALRAVDSDATDECADVANLGLHQSAAEVRRLACEYFVKHGQPAQAPWLLDLLEDHDRSVRLAVIRALGNCGNQVAVRGLPASDARHISPNLRSLLTSSDQTIRIEAAISLCRLGANEGMQELIRLSYHPNPKIREKIVSEMGRSGQTRFVGHLVTMGWTEKNDQVRQYILDSLDQLVPPENRPSTLGQARADAKIKCWVQWWQKQQGLPARSVPAGAPLTISRDAAS